MRDLHDFELKFVSGAGHSPSGPCDCPDDGKGKGKGKGKRRNRGNNGFGNGGDDGVPGNSGFPDDDR